MTLETNSPIYFKGLNGVRAIASSIVVVSHIDQFSRLFNFKMTGLLHAMQGYAVDMFFVLSGFLITYLLFVEKKKTGTIDLRKFYLRRIFRIWPIYYLSILISIALVYFKIVPSPDQLLFSVGLYAFLAANVAFVLNIAISSITPLWSVGVEEQFYLVWPHLIKRSTNHFWGFVIFYFTFEAAKLVVYFYFSPESKLYYLMSATSLNIMCMGAIGAYLVYTKHGLLNFIYRKEVQLFSWGILIFSCLYKPLHLYTFIDQELNSVFYLVIIMNASSNNNCLISLETNWLNFLGRISYGMYVYHMIVIYMVSRIFLTFNLQVNLFLMYVIVIVITIFVSTISYYYFEMFFLKKKHNFSIVESTDRARKND
jgi:peptidoglycan/LPS O-acetylase OafA/YrhL